MVGKFHIRSSCRMARLLAVPFASFVAVVVMGSLQAHVQDTWTLSSSLSGDWNNAANWSGNLVPTGTDTAYIANGGTANVTQPEPYAYIVLGGTSGSGNVVMTGGSLGATGISGATVGFTGPGSFTQSGGTFVSNGYLYLAYSSSPGTYNLSGGQLLVDYAEYIGFYGPGVFTQSGGTNLVGILNGQLNLGAAAQSSGTYNLSGGQLWPPMNTWARPVREPLRSRVGRTRSQEVSSSLILRGAAAPTSLAAAASCQPRSNTSAAPGGLTSATFRVP